MIITWIWVIWKLDKAPLKPNSAICIYFSTPSMIESNIIMQKTKNLHLISLQINIERASSSGH